MIVSFYAKERRSTGGTEEEEGRERERREKILRFKDLFVSKVLF